MENICLKDRSLSLAQPHGLLVKPGEMHANCGWSPAPRKKCPVKVASLMGQEKEEEERENERKHEKVSKDAEFPKAALATASGWGPESSFQALLSRSQR